ncbi:hypothetical protein ACNR9V_03290 [Parageobacillus thermoglucosidasius]|uniref:hypothetical protein n=1 Tax=Parageobacillus thermoglucosidasius TaxID=1426 RepID=UPI003B679D8F
MGMKSLEQYRADFIDVIKRTMATNLTNKGTSASATESLQSLVDKIANVNTGKKWASGTFTSSGNSITISGLSFRPSLVLVYVSTADTDSWMVGILQEITPRYNERWNGLKYVRHLVTQQPNISSPPSSGYDLSGSPNNYITNNGFVIYLYGVGYFRNYAWIAIE